MGRMEENGGGGWRKRREARGSCDKSCLTEAVSRDPTIVFVMVLFVLVMFWDVLTCNPREFCLRLSRFHHISQTTHVKMRPSATHLQSFKANALDSRPKRRFWRSSSVAAPSVRLPRTWRICMTSKHLAQFKPRGCRRKRGGIDEVQNIRKLSIILTVVSSEKLQLPEQHPQLQHDILREVPKVLPKILVQPSRKKWDRNARRR